MDLCLDLCYFLLGGVFCFKIIFFIGEFILRGQFSLTFYIFFWCYGGTLLTFAHSFTQFISCFWGKYWTVCFFWGKDNQLNNCFWKIRVTPLVQLNPG